MQFTNKEQKAADQLRERLNDILPNLDWYDSHDVNLLRFVRAREYDIGKAEELFRKQLQYRTTNKLDTYIHEPFNSLLLEKLPITGCKEDRDGTIICLIPIGIWDLRQLLEAGHALEIKKYIFQCLEKAINYLKDHSTPEDIQTQFVILFDYEHFSIRQAMCKQVVSFWIDVFQIYESVYAERLKLAFVVNAPKIFEIFFSMLRHVLTAHTLRKIRIFGSNPDKYRKVLTLQIPPRELPSQYGGTDTSHPWYGEELGMEFPPRAPIFPENEFFTETIPAGGKIVRSYDLNKGQRITWNFKSQEYDIGFRFCFNDKPMFPYARADSHLHVQDGLVDVKETGSYSLVFDNSYSKYRAKNLSYAVHIEETPSKG